MDREIRTRLSNRLVEFENMEAQEVQLHASMREVELEIRALIDQLQPRIEVTKPDWPPTEEETARWAKMRSKRPEPETPSERVHDALLHAGRRLTTEEIAHITGLGRRQVGPCLGALVKGRRIRNVGNGTWAAA